MLIIVKVFCVFCSQIFPRYDNNKGIIVRAVRIYAPPKIDPALERLVGIEGGGLLINGGGASTLIIMERERAVGGWDSHNSAVPSRCKVLFWSSSAAG